MSNLVHRLALGTLKVYIVPYGKVSHQLVNLSYDCDMKSGLSLFFCTTPSIDFGIGGGIRGSGGKTRAGTVREKYLENEIFSRSGKSQGILWMVREI